MNHLSRFFVHKEKIKDMESKNRSRRLDRRYAKKNIHYEPTTPPSDQPVSLRTRSLDLYDAADETNFRIDGNEGIDVVFQKIGVSGFEDFAIPLEDWEARKMRSSSDSLILSRTHEADEATYKTTSDSAAIVAGVDASKLFGMVEDKGIDGEIGDDLVDDDSQRHEIPASVSAGNGGGIKGLRPPLLAPPPVISLPKMDTDCSTWELRNSFTPDGASCSSTSRGVLDSDDEVDREIIGQREANPLGFAGRTALSASCSFTTSNDDDSSSTTTEPMSNNISPNLRIRRTITRWDKGDVVLGRGSFGSVYVGIAEDGFFFAVKEVSLLDQGDTGRQSILHLEQEIALLSQFEHENIVQYYGTDRDESTLYIFLELVSMGSLLSLYHKYPLREPVVSSYTRQILHGLKYLHEQKVVHRDIKCANILVDSNGSVKLADFGLAKATKLNDIKSCKGTPFWMAPEVLKGKTQGYGLAADIWSLGCTVLEMLTRQIPYYPLNPMQAMYRIGSGKPPPIPDLPSQEAHDFILKCLQVNPDSRPTAAQLLDHPFVRRPLSTSSASPSPSPSPSHQTPPINRRTH